MSELKPCPFCGQKAEADTMTIISAKGIKKVVPIILCQCGALAMGLSEGDAMDTWNKRADSATQSNDSNALSALERGEANER